MHVESDCVRAILLMWQLNQIILKCVEFLVFFFFFNKLVDGLISALELLVKLI